MTSIQPYSALSPSRYYTYAGDRGGAIGFNRRTWNAGQTIGRALKSWMQKPREVRNDRKRKARAARARPWRGVAAPVPAGGGDSKSSFTLKRPLTGKLPPVASELPPQWVVNNSSGRDEAGVGLQSWVLVGDYFLKADIQQPFTLLNSEATAKILLKNVRGETLITNQENVNGRFTIYDVMTKKDTDATVSNPQTALSTGSADPSGSAAGDYVIPGYSPFMNPRFTEYFKVLQTTEVILSPGACHSHVVNYTPNKYLSKEAIARIAGTGIAGITLYTLVQYHGTPINDVNTQTQVSLSHIAMDYVQKEQYLYNYMLYANTAVSMHQTLPSAFTTAGNTMQDDGVELAENEA